MTVLAPSAVKMTVFDIGLSYKFREDGSHYNGGNVFFGYGYRAITEPRLKMVRKYYRQGAQRGSREDSFYVDGKAVADFQAALEALSAAVTFTAEEIAALRGIPDEAADLREMIPFDLRYSLREKGAIEYGPPGHFRRTDVGRAAIA